MGCYHFDIEFILIFFLFDIRENFKLTSLNITQLTLHTTMCSIFTFFFNSQKRIHNDNHLFMIFFLSKTM